MKSGCNVESAEATALELIAEKLDIPVPRLQSTSTSPDGTTSISMDYVDGHTLSDMWISLSNEEKQAIAEQLRVILSAMRSLQPEDNTISSCGGGPTTDIRRYTIFKGGPFAGEDAFNDFLASSVLSGTPPILVRKFRQQLRSDHRLVFTHGDIAQHNIIIRDNNVVALLDWQCAGWFPEYWDYVKFFTRPAKKKDWYEYADIIFPQSYDNELFQWQFLARYQNP